MNSSSTDQNVTHQKSRHIKGLNLRMATNGLGDPQYLDRTTSIVSYPAIWRFPEVGLLPNHSYFTWISQKRTSIQLLRYPHGPRKPTMSPCYGAPRSDSRAVVCPNASCTIRYSNMATEDPLFISIHICLYLFTSICLHLSLFISGYIYL